MFVVCLNAFWNWHFKQLVKSEERWKLMAKKDPVDENFFLLGFLSFSHCIICELA